MHHVGSLSCTFFTEEPVWNYDDAAKSDTAAFAAFCRYLFENGIYTAPSQFEAMFVSMAHTDREFDRTLEVMERYFR